MTSAWRWLWFVKPPWNECIKEITSSIKVKNRIFVCYWRDSQKNTIRIVFLSKKCGFLVCSPSFPIAFFEISIHIFATIHRYIWHQLFLKSWHNLSNSLHGKISRQKKSIFFAAIYIIADQLLMFDDVLTSFNLTEKFCRQAN